MTTTASQTPPATAKGSGASGAAGDLQDRVAKLPLAAGCRERADVALLGLPAAMLTSDRDFHAIVMLLAHCESQGLTSLGFNPDDAVEIDRFGEDDAESSPEPTDSSRGNGADDESGSGESGSGKSGPNDSEAADEPVLFTGHLPFWDLLVAIHAATVQEGSPFMADFAAAVPPNAEFVLDCERKRLLFARAADNEQRLWAAVRVRAARPHSVPMQATTTILESLFATVALGPTEVASRAEQVAAARLIVGGAFSLLTGSPGTGKTFTLVRTALAWLCSEEAQAAATPGYRARRIMLMAPTGRAASRMGELIGEALHKLENDPANLTALGPHGPDAIDSLRSARPSTIHSALGFSPVSRQRFRHHSGNLLDAGLVIVDETSMVGLELARRLLDALPEESQICLVGDPGQLRAVEMGSVLYDLVSATASDPALAACHARLKVSRRFPPGSMIDRLARAINGDQLADADGTGESLAGLLEASRIRFEELQETFTADGDDPSTSESVEARIRWLEVSESELPVIAKELVKLQAADLRSHAHDPDVSKTLKRAVVLGVHRRGPAGAHTLAEHAVQWLRGKKVTDPFAFPDGSSLIITRNNKGLGLSNGDLAVVQAAPGGSMAVFSSDKQYDVRMLPAHAPAAALTVHKAQGSEWRHVVVVLPAKPTRLLTASLLYTACSRATGSVTLVTTGEIATRLQSLSTTL